MSTLNNLLKMICKNPKLTSNIQYLEDILQHEDYIIFFYCKQFAKEDIVLTRKSLEVALDEQKIYWINPKSIYSEKYGKLTYEYIQAKYLKQLTDDFEYANALMDIVLTKYDEIQQAEDMTLEEYNSLIKSEKQYLQKEITKKIIETIQPIILGQLESITYKGIRYYSTNILELISKMTSDKILELSDIQPITTKQQEHENQLDSIATHLSTADRLFKWNISGEVEILKDLIPGDVVGIIAGDKVGKTKFTMGEIVYPALLNGKNVKLYSGEMDIEDLYTTLVIKHIYSTYGLTLSFDVVRDIILITSKIKNKTVSDKELLLINSYSREVVEYVLSGLSFFKNSPYIGRLKLIRAGVNSSEFLMENYENNNLIELQNTSEDMQFDLIVLDHINLFHTKTGMTLENFIKSIVRTSKNSIKPFVSVLINHIKSDDLTSAITPTTTAKDLEDIKISSHGTRELEKSATLFLLLIELPEEKRAGQVLLKVGASRSYSVISEFKTNVFKLIANKSVNDFCLVGQRKMRYEHLEDKLNGGDLNDN